MSEPVPPAAPQKQRLQDRLWSFRAVIAVALASVILGGLGGAVLANVGDHDRGRFGPGQGRFGPGGPMRGPGMMNDRQRGRWDEWQRDQPPWGQGNQPGQPPTGLPNPRSSPLPSSPSPTTTR